MTYGKGTADEGEEVICDGCGECIGMTENLADNFGFLDCITVEDGTKRETLHFCDWECFKKMGQPCPAGKARETVETNEGGDSHGG